MKQSSFSSPGIAAIDLDGTLLNSLGQLTIRSRNALQQWRKASGLSIIATARPARLARWLDLPPDTVRFAICGNGAALYDFERKTIRELCCLSRETVLEIVAAIRHVASECSFGVEAASLIAHEADFRLSFVPLPHEQLVGDLPSLLKDPATKLMIQHPFMDLGELMNLVAPLIGERGNITNSTGRFLEISAPGVDKASALALVCHEEALGSSSDVIAFGDMPNDVTMLQWANHGVAMENAHRSVLEAADEITLSNDNDGVAAILEKRLSAM